MRVFLVCLAAFVGAAHGFSVAPPTTASTSTALNAIDRRQVLVGGGIAAAASILSSVASPVFAAGDVLPNGVTYTVQKSGKGPAPEKGELAAIRFKATTQDGKVIDDIFETAEPYYTRVGLGGMLPGVEGALPYMKLGDYWTLTIPPALAFGAKGRPASAGKPRIPGDSTIIFEVEMVGLPGKEPELIELIGDN